MENIGDIFTKDGIKEVSIGQVLRFEREGKIHSYKVVKRHIKRREVWVRPVRLYRPDEVQFKDKVEE